MFGNIQGDLNRWACIKTDKTGLWVKGSPVFDREADLTPIVTINQYVCCPFATFAPGASAGEFLQGEHSHGRIWE